jgi:hypothetical protein
LHDVTLRWRAAQNPARLRLLPLLLGRAAPIHCLEWQGRDRAMPVWVLPRPSVPASGTGAR